MKVQTITIWHLNCASHCRLTGRTILTYWSKEGITVYMLQVFSRWGNKTHWNKT